MGQQGLPVQSQLMPQQQIVTSQAMQAPVGTGQLLQQQQQQQMLQHASVGVNVNQQRLGYMGPQSGRVSFFKIYDRFE